MAGRKTQRVFALILAGLFLITSVGFTGMVIWQESNRGDEKVDTNQPTDQAGALKGTKLADFKPAKSVKKLEIIDTQEGTGEAVKDGANITAHYTGALAADGVIFESSLDMGEPATFGLDQVIEGWTKGVPGMKVGGKRRLIIPYAQAYGEAGSPPAIPAKADLVFDIELVSIN